MQYLLEEKEYKKLTEQQDKEEKKDNLAVNRLKKFMKPNKVKIERQMIDFGGEEEYITLSYSIHDLPEDIVTMFKQKANRIEKDLK